MKFIKIMPDYHCSGLWAIVNDTFYEYIDLDSDFLHLPATLKSRIEKWQDRYDKTLDQDRPQDSGFPSTEEEDLFEKEGLHIWKALMTLFPDDNITYFSVKDYKLYQTVSDYLLVFPERTQEFIDFKS